MRLESESKTGAVWTQVDDPRITGIGRVLRKLHLDEFPQLFNVLKGEMSIIGPRPERPEFAVVLSESIPGYMNRSAVRPGITGLAQVNLPPDTDLVSVQRKQVLDLEYIKNAGLWLDLRMLICTFLRLIGISGALAMRIMRVQRTVSIPSPIGTAHGEVTVATPDALDKQAQALTDTVDCGETVEWETAQERPGEAPTKTELPLGNGKLAIKHELSQLDADPESNVAQRAIKRKPSPK